MLSTSKIFLFVEHFSLLPEDARTSQNNLVGREARVLYARPIRCFNFKGSTFCRCPDSFKWNRFAMRCEKSIVVPNAIKQKVISPNPTMCFMFIGTRMCRCPRGYKWDLNMQHCKLACKLKSILGLYLIGNHKPTKL